VNTLIIAEKPSVALRIASALGGGNQEKKQASARVNYYEIREKKGTTYVAAAVGHLFTIRQKDKSRGYPVLEVEWAPSHTVSQASAFTKGYLDALVSISKGCQLFVNACDYDIEGTVIGTNIIKFLNQGSFEGRAKRMKFSTTTTEDLLAAYSSLTSLDINNFYAGEARHMLDWLWGINLSRALTNALVGRSFSRSLSIGRVQGPALAILSRHESAIEKFVPKPFWRLIANIGGVEFSSTRGDIFDRAVAEQAHLKAKKAARSGTVDGVEAVERKVNPYPPFDLTSLQLESSRALHMDPSRTLAVAQSLYERSYISYPRTSSQKLPPSLGLPRIISDIAKNPVYERLAKKLIQRKSYSPKEGAKSDEAHPSIFPTGVRPAELSAEEARLYDIITKRFLSVFAEPATVVRMKVTVDFAGEKYSANGARVANPGWLEFYDYTKVEERELPPMSRGDRVAASAMEMKQMETQPPKRYSKATMIAELEKRNLGTKATRASIVDTLFKRNYIEGSSIRVTKFGMSVYEALENNCKMIVDEATTRRLEEDMEGISKGSRSEAEVIEEGKNMLLEALKAFDEHKLQIAEAMRKGLYESETVLGRCPKDGGNLVIRRSRAGKFFAACANYPKCTNTYSLPQKARIVPTGETCEHCKTPIIKVFRSGRKPFQMDLDPNCVTKKDWQNRGAAEDTAEKDVATQAAPRPPSPKASDEETRVIEKKATGKRQPKIPRGAKAAKVAAKPKKRKHSKTEGDGA
jgi:DNA topoisomerase-1